MPEKTPDNWSGNTGPAITVQGFEPDSKIQLLRSYQDGGFQVNDTRIEGPVFLLPRLVRSWAPPALATLGAEHIASWMGQDKAELFLLGTGGQPDHPFFELRAALAKTGCKLEVMATPAACRTWNLLMTEGRSVAAGLLVAPPAAK